MATVKTPEKALATALSAVPFDGKGQKYIEYAEVIIANLPENTQLITDVKAFRTVLTEALGASVADLGPKVDAQVLPKRLQVRMRELLETLED